MRRVIKIAKQTFTRFNDHKSLRLSAALAYYAIFSLGPLLFILTMLAGFVFGEEAVRRQIHDQLQSFMGTAASKTVESMMSQPKLGSGLITTIIGIFTLIFGASGVFAQLQDSLNTVWEVEAKPNRGIWLLIRNRFLSLAMILGLGFLLLISMVLSTLAQALAQAFGSWLPVSKPLVMALGIVFDLVVVTIFFSLVFKFLPDVKVGWKPVWRGAIFTAVLFMLGKYLLSAYLGRQATTSSYGAAGSVVAILLWVYYATLILLLGAEFTRVLATEKGEKVTPNEYAVGVTDESRGKQGIHKPGAED